MSDVKFPRALYRRGSVPGQIDHPGWLSMVVADHAALDVALSEGWLLEMRDPPPAPTPRAPTVTDPPPAPRRVRRSLKRMSIQ